jgi:CDP-6-deoxy-D-xylo-4-hexulose-3-dehydrase
MIVATMPKKYLLAEQTISTGELEELAQWLRTNPWLTQGPLVKEFEKSWASWLGRRHALFVNSGSSANLLMYYALLESTRLRNHKVIVPAVSWATTVAPAIQLGFEPIMCDADPQTFGLDLHQFEDLLRKHGPAAVILVHVLGCPNDMNAILDLKRRYDFILMEDCCAAHGSTFAGRKVGTFGELSSFSFFYGHHMSTIEGGMVCTDDEQFQDILLLIRNHGWPKDLAPEKEAQLARRYGAIEFNRTFTFYQPGFNVRSTDLNAKIGLMQMLRLDDMIARRVENHRTYQQRILDTPGFHCQQNRHAVISSISFACLASSVEHRARIAAALKENSVETRPLGGGNMSRQPFWSDRYGSMDMPMADRIHRTSFQLPNHHLLSVADVNTICDLVTSIRP